MTRPLRHRRCEIENAGRVARDMGLTVRLEVDGAITLIPDTHNDRFDSAPLNSGNSLRAWRDRHSAGKSHGRS